MSPILKPILVSTLLLSVLARPFNRKMNIPGTSTDILSPSAKRQEIESQRCWSEIKQNCVGSWSGSMVHYDVTKKCDLVIQPVGKLNFKLKVVLDQSKKSGTWSVYNAMKQGDTISVPVGGSPPESKVHTIAFDKVIVRALKKNSPTIEIGFFDRRGDSMRRTAVLVYQDEKSPKKPDRLNVLHVMQQRCLKNDKNFEQETELLDDGNLHLMPDEAPFNMSETQFEKLIPTKIESIDLSTYEREAATKINENQAKEICKSIFGRLKDGKGFTKVLENGICMSVPFKLEKKEIEKFIFGRKWDDGSFQAVEIEYSMEPPLEPTKMTMYLFK